jgi:CBS domain-containing protein
VSSLPRRRTVADVMTRQVHVATPATPFKFLVRLLEENRISGVPVVDMHGKPLGVVSESDLLLKGQRAELEAVGGLLHPLRHREEREKAEGVVASDLMTSPAITIPEDTTITDAARQMQRSNIRRLIVVDGRGMIAGIVSRRDLLQVFLRTDEDLRDEVVARILRSVVPGDAEGLDVEVSSNVITLSGEVDRRSDAEILGRLARDLDGVVDLVNRLTFRWDDLKPRAGAI